MGQGPEQRDEAIVGEHGVTYGLQIRTQSEKRRPESKKVAGVFGDDSSDSEDGAGPGGREITNKMGSKGNAANLVVGKMIARQMAAMDKDDKIKKSHAEALREDASVFDYDVHVDAIQDARRKKVEARQQEKVERKSKYISGLLETAEQRKKEQEILFEKRLEKEREAEEAVYGTKERFVTGAYRRKLEEEQKWKVEQEKKREEDEANAVEKKGSMAGFYSNYLKVVSGGGEEGVGAVKNESMSMETGVEKEEGRGVETRVGTGAAEMSEMSEEKKVEAKDVAEDTRASAGAETRQASKPEVSPMETRAEPSKIEEDPATRTARLKREREEKIAKAKARYAERVAAKRAR